MLIDAAMQEFEKPEARQSLAGIRQEAERRWMVKQAIRETSQTGETKIPLFIIPKEVNTPEKVKLFAQLWRVASDPNRPHGSSYQPSQYGVLRVAEEFPDLPLRDKVALCRAAPGNGNDWGTDHRYQVDAFIAELKSLSPEELTQTTRVFKIAPQLFLENAQWAAQHVDLGDAVNRAILRTAYNGTFETTKTALTQKTPEERAIAAFPEGSYLGTYEARSMLYALGGQKATTAYKEEKGYLRTEFDSIKEVVDYARTIRDSYAQKQLPETTANITGEQGLSEKLAQQREV